MRNLRILSHTATSRSRKAVVLDVRARRNTTRKRYRARIFNIIWKSSLIVTIVGGSWFGTNKVFTKFFYANSEYNIGHIVFNTQEGELSQEEAISATGIHVGTNIFMVNLENARKGLLAIPQVQDAQIERILPNTIRISAQLKKPVAWLISKKNSKDPYTAPDSFLLEQGGAIYKPSLLSSSYFSLPVIYGLNQRLLAEGDPLAKEDLGQALQLLCLATQRCNPAIILRVLDLSEGYCIKARGAANEKIVFATENFEEQLNRLQDLMRFCKQTGKRLESVNLFVHRNTPVQFSIALEDQTILRHTGNNKSLVQQ